MFTALRIGDSFDEYCAFADGLVIDASAVTFIDVAGLRLLQRVFGHAAGTGRTAWLHQPSRVVRRLTDLPDGGEPVPVCSFRDDKFADPITPTIWSIGMTG